MSPAALPCPCWCCVDLQARVASHCHLSLAVVTAGGVLVDVLGFQGTFLVTAALKAASYLPLLPLLRYVPDGICRHAAPAAAAAAAGYAALPDSAAANEDADAVRPLCAADTSDDAALSEPQPQSMPR